MSVVNAVLEQGFDPETVNESGEHWDLIDGYDYARQIADASGSDPTISSPRQ